jgi:hypothetical protein
VLKGEIARAIEIVDQFYPNLFAANKPLLFALKIRQFIEMLGAISQNEVDLSVSRSFIQIFVTDYRFISTTTYSTVHISSIIARCFTAL